MASNKQYVLVNYTGFHNRLITDRDITLFNITKDNLNFGVKVELGKAPNDIFFKDPTPYYNLYEKYHWPQVQRHMYIKRATVLDVVHEETVLKTAEYINNSTDVVKYNKSLTEDVEFTVFTFWSEKGFPNEDIFYRPCIDFPTNRHCFINKWRDSTIQSIKEPLGVKNVKGTVKIKPGQTIVSKLIANKTAIFVEIEYSAKLIGSIITDYENLYGKYHFYAPAVADIMKAGSIPNEIVTTERIEIRGYTDPRMFMHDKETGEEIRIFSRVKLTGHKNKIILQYIVS